MAIRDLANNPLVAGFTGQAYTVSAVSDSGMYRPQFPITTAANTAGGRGGVVYRINTLADNTNAPVAVGDGSFRCSLRRALQIETGPRIIVFEISGYLNVGFDPTFLVNTITVYDPFVTIAAQTAPSPGITLKQGGIGIGTHDVVVQHLRVRPGVGTCNLGIVVGNVGNPLFNIVLDHCSTSWYQDGGVIFDDGQDMLCWRTLIGQGLDFPPGGELCTGGGNGPSRAFVIGGAGTDIIQSILAFNATRNPFMVGTCQSNLINNIIYDFVVSDGIAIFNGDSHGNTLVGPWKFNAISNVILGGLDTYNAAFGGAFAFRYSASSSYPELPGNQVYRNDNLILQGSATGPITPEINDLSYNPNIGVPAVTVPTMTILGSAAVESFLQSNIGSRPLDRDSVDVMILNLLANRTGHLINTESQVGGFPTLAVNNRVFQMPSNPNGISPIRGAPFTIIEDYLEQLARDLEPAS